MKKIIITILVSIALLDSILLYYFFFKLRVFRTDLSLFLLIDIPYVFTVIAITYVYVKLLVKKEVDPDFENIQLYLKVLLIIIYTILILYQLFFGIGYLFDFSEKNSMLYNWSLIYFITIGFICSAVLLYELTRPVKAAIYSLPTESI